MPPRHWHGISIERKNLLLFGRKLYGQALAAAAADEKLAGLDHLRTARASAHRGFARAVELGELGRIASLSRQVAEISKDILKMSGEWRDDPKNVINIAVINLPAIAPFSARSLSIRPVLKACTPSACVGSRARAPASRPSTCECCRRSAAAPPWSRPCSTRSLA
jgi:hypothetical protein